MRANRACCAFFALSASFLIFSLCGRVAAQTVLVDFGPSEAANSYGLSGWDTLLLDNSMSYSSAGPAGVTLLSDLDNYSDFMGVGGSARKFSKGERIVATWYNDSDDPISFTSRVSFTDRGNPSEGSPDGRWYTMRSFDDYRTTYQSIHGHGTARTAFNIESAGVHKTDSAYSLVNINLCIEWFDNALKQYLICDKIELWYDADTAAPPVPVGLSAAWVTSSQVQLQWSSPSGGTDAAEYVVYRGNEIEDYSRKARCTIFNLNQSSDFYFSVSGVDRSGNESARSAEIEIRTSSFHGRADLINPSGLEYVGAFLLPEEFSYGADALAYNPGGDGGQSSTADNYPGSLFAVDINQPERAFVGEVSVPSPVVSKTRNVDELNKAAILQSPVNIRPANIDSWSYVDVWLTGLEYVEGENRLYSSWAFYYDVIGDKTASMSCVAADDLSGSIKHGAWFAGSSDSSSIPRDAYLNDYLFAVPKEWADKNIGGRSLINGRYREGGLSGLGPTMYATKLCGTDLPPVPGFETACTPLLQYGPVEESDNYDFPNSINDYNHADWWKGADWISAAGQAAVVFIGNKALGNTYYGYTGERMRNDWVYADEPYPAFAETDPDGKGWRAYNSVPMIIFYDPADLAAVAANDILPCQPQPYAALRLDPQLFYGSKARICSAAFDSSNGLLFVAEIVPEISGSAVIHVWKVNYVPAGLHDPVERPGVFLLEQNFPNPFNPSTMINYQLPINGRVTLEIYDVLGRRVATLVDEVEKPGYHEVKFDGNGLASGVYFYRLEAGGKTLTRKLTLLK